MELYHQTENTRCYDEVSLTLTSIFMLNDLFSTNFTERLANKSLLDAMKKHDLRGMMVALSKKPYLSGLKMRFYQPNIPHQETRETYDVEGSLEIAAKLRLPKAGFKLLLDAGATPISPLHSLFNASGTNQSDAQEITILIQTYLDGSAASVSSKPIKPKP